MKHSMLVHGLLAMGIATAMPAMAQSVKVGDYQKRDFFEEIKISPNGDYYAATVPQGDRTTLVILSRADNKVTATFGMGRDTHVYAFNWVNPERVVISMAEKMGQGEMEEPQPLGELFAINADGSKQEFLVGQRLRGAGTGSKIKTKKVEMVAAFLIDELPNDDRKVLISVQPFSENDVHTRIERMDVYTGGRVPVARVPVKNASFVADNAGVVRFASGFGADNVNKLYYRSGEGEPWKLLNDEAVSKLTEAPIGFSTDNATAYLHVNMSQGPNAIVAMDVATGTRKQVLRDDDSDPFEILYKPGTSEPVGVVYMDGKPRTEFFEPASTEARLQRSLEGAFPGEFPHVTSKTKDGKLALVQVRSDRNPGDFYVFDTVAKKAAHLISRRDWFDPARMAEVRPFAFKARDGLPLKGYLTLPHGKGGKNLPLVVMPHGGPFDVFDTWHFDSGAQMLAAAGYAVLQVNFRGSGNHGRAFVQAGANEWGGKMQDDVTDATHWAVKEGIANPGRMCIYGGSYGAYAALMGVAREPSLYRCAAGVVGVYDLPTMHTQGDIQRRGSGETFLREWIGERSTLAKVSPTTLAGQIKVPVFLSAGGEDKRAPIEHSRMMERALKSAGVPVETLYYPTEGHGYFLDANRVEYGTRLLAFLARHLGGETAAPAAAGPAAASK